MRSRVPKALATELTRQVSFLFKSSLQSDELPMEWLRRMVVHIYKKTLRTISLTSVVCKTLERLIVEHINLFLNNNALLSSE